MCAGADLIRSPEMVRLVMEAAVAAFRALPRESDQAESNLVHPRTTRDRPWRIGRPEDAPSVPPGYTARIADPLSQRKFACLKGPEARGQALFLTLNGSFAIMDESAVGELEVPNWHFKFQP